MVNIKDINISTEDKKLINKEIEIEDELQLIFDKQKELMKKYWTIKECWSIHTFEVQSSIRRFSKYTTEELSEAFEEIFKYKNITWDKILEYNQIDKQKKVKDLNWDILKHFQEEVADAIHFYMEKLILSWIEDIDQLYQEIEWIIEIETWKNIKILNYTDLENYIKDNFNYKKIDDVTLDELYNFALRFLYSVNISDNFLRNKEWKKSNVLTNVNWFYKSLWWSLYNFVEFLLAAQIDKEKLLELYILKNNVNHFRIKSKY